MDTNSETNRQRLTELLVANNLKQKEAVDLIVAQTAHKLSLRTFEAWLAQPGLSSSRRTPDWAVVGLERALGLRE